LSRLIREFKSDLSPAPILGSALCFIIKRNLYGLSLKDIDYVTYVPKHRDELKEDQETGERYNQSKLLAEIFSNLSGIKLIDLFIKKEPLSMRRLTRNDRYSLA